jgi:hypothetical protein
MEMDGFFSVVSDRFGLHIIHVGLQCRTFDFKIEGVVMINYLIGFAISFAAGYIFIKQLKRIKSGKCSVHDDCESCGVNSSCPAQNRRDDKK